MGDHWKPQGETVVGPWGRPEAYLARGGGGGGMSRGMLLLVACAVLIGLGAGYFLSRTADSDTGKPDQPIEWNVVQAVPTRAPDAEDVEWEKRTRELDSPVIASPEGARQSSLDRFADTRDDAAPAASRKIYVFDGDTFVMGGRKIRIAGIDAPEIHPPRCAEEARLGLAAKEKLGALLSSGTVTISGASHDKYGRDLRNVAVNGQDVGEAMIGAGLAREYGSGRRSWC